MSQLVECLVSAVKGQQVEEELLQKDWPRLLLPLLDPLLNKARKTRNDFRTHACFDVEPPLRKDIKYIDMIPLHQVALQVRLVGVRGPAERPVEQRRVLWVSSFQ